MEIVPILKCAFFIFYLAILFVFAIYGMHRYFLLYLYYRHRHKKPKPKAFYEQLPRVTVQLPMYNEKYVAPRLIDAVMKLDYPRNLLDIQILDDSTDDTTEIMAQKVEEARAKGFDITLIHRANRTGYKAGALQNGLKSAKGDFIAIFDADFIPNPKIFTETINFFTDPAVALVQSRWGHVNRNFSTLTEIQSIFLDGHFVIEHGARSRSGRFFNFNGTAGIWRKAAIMDSGGWQHDTLTEDLDLSYRAQLNGWRFIYVPDLVSPAELPVDMNAFKSQQHHWTKGSIQTCMKMLPKIWKSRAPLKAKIEATFHLTSNYCYLLMVALAAMILPSMYLRSYYGIDNMTPFLMLDLPMFITAMFSFLIFYTMAQYEQTAKWYKKIIYVPMLVALGVGLVLNNAKAVLEAMFRNETPFPRTPKYNVVTQEDKKKWKKCDYKTGKGVMPYIEVVIGIYFLVTAYIALMNSAYIAIPLMLVFAGGTLYVGILSLFHCHGLGLKGKTTFGPETIDCPAVVAADEKDAA
jgi:cellulose synthase/poly-beta-1,6-N-acetylglucosamine synthase-like glycosyltransferase